MGQAGTNVIPCEWCSSHLGSSFELVARRLFRTRQKMGTEGENCPALIRCKKLGQKIISAPLGKIKSLAGRERVRGEMVSPGSHFIHRRVWNDFICCVDSHYTPLYTTVSWPSLPLSLLAATGQKPPQHCPNNISVRYCFVYLLDTLAAFTYIDKTLKRQIL